LEEVTGRKSTWSWGAHSSFTTDALVQFIISSVLKITSQTPNFKITYIKTNLRSNKKGNEKALKTEIKLEK
jgi:hypothetical protein